MCKFQLIELGSGLITVEHLEDMAEAMTGNRNSDWYSKKSHERDNEKYKKRANGVLKQTRASN